MNTKLITRNPFALRTGINDMFDNFFQMPSYANENNSDIELDVTEDEKSYYVNASLVGVKKEDINVDLANNVLTIKAVRNHEHKDKKHHIQEFYYGSFERSIRLPVDIDKDKVDANFKNGMLTLHILKSEKSQTKRIEVKS